MLKFRGFRASLNFGYTNKNKDDIENYPTGPENISLAGAYKANREEFFGYGSLIDPPKKITPAMVKLPPSRNQQPSLAIQPSKSTSDLATPPTKLPAILRKSNPDMSTDPRGRTTSESNETTGQVKKDGQKSQSQEQKLLERQQKKQKKIAEEKAAKLKKEQEKAEKEREKLEKERAKEEAKAAKKVKPKREKKSKSKAPPLPKTAPPTTIDNPIVILDQPPTESLPFLTVNQSKTTEQPPQQVTNQQSTTPPQLPQDIQAPPRTKQTLKAEAKQTTKQPPRDVAAPQETTNQPRAPSRQPKAAQRTNPLGQTSLNYSTNTLDSNISRNSGPPPYEEVMPNTNDKAGNTSFGKRIDETNNSWDLVSQHREQMSRPMAKERRPKRMVMDLKFDTGFAQNKENSDV